jgi:hypothetical protein
MLKPHQADNLLGADYCHFDPEGSEITVTIQDVETQAYTAKSYN